MEQLTKEQLTKVKEEINKVLQTLYIITMDYQSRMQHIDKMLDDLEKPAESKKA